MPSPQNQVVTVAKTPLVQPGIASAVAGMQGVALWGPENSPFLVTSPAEFEEKAGKRSATYPMLYDSAMLFFQNGGRQLYINRTTGAGAAQSTVTIQANAQNTIVLKGRYKGARGNKLARKITQTSVPAGTISGTVAAGSTSAFPVTSISRFNIGDQVSFTEGADVKRGIVAAINGNNIVLEAAITVPVGGYSATTTILIENYKIEIFDANVPVATYANLQTSPNSPMYFVTVISNDDYRLVDATLFTPAPTFAANTDTRPATDTNPVLLTGGADGSAPTDTELKGSQATFTGVWAWDGARDAILLGAPGILAIPAVTVAVYKEYETYARYRADKDPVVVLADPPSGLSPSSMKTWFTTTLGASFRSMSSWYPWLLTKDPMTNATVARPPSGVVMGLTAAAHRRVNIAQAPAGEVDGDVVGVLGTELAVPLQEGDPRYDDLYSAGVNCFIRFSGQAPARAYGNITADVFGSFSQWHKNLVFCVVQRQIKKLTSFVNFRANNVATRGQVERTIRAYFKTLYAAGVLDDSQGEDLAYFVQCDENNNTPQVTAQKRLVARYGIRVVDSAEMVYQTLEQDTRALEQSLGVLR